MCGIAGVNQAATTADVERMLTLLRHRGPDGSGLEELTQSCVGHTRLAIIDVAGGQQPIRFGPYTISFNGEIYNYQALRDQYLAADTLHTHTDTEVILHLYAKFGPRCVELLDGMFAVAIVGDDGLFLARDPIGIKPLYTAHRGEAVYFASEIKALMPVADGIREFPAGQWYHSRLGFMQYYRVGQDLSALEGNVLRELAQFEHEDQVLPVIERTLHEAVRKRLMSDVPLGVSLSGGLDSSIVALLARRDLDRLETFAVGVVGSEDLAAARDVSQFLGTQHHERVYDQPAMLRVLPEVLYYLESFDPALVRSAIPNYFLAQLSAEHVKVFLTGEGADELYAGYDYLARFEQPDALHAELVHIVGALHNTNLQRADRMSMAHGLEARVPFLDVRSIALALGLPALWKLRGEGRPAKALLRRAFAEHLPTHIVNRPKQKFSQGAGSSDLIAQVAEDTIGDAEFAAERTRLAQTWNYHLGNKEALYYYRLLSEAYRDEHIFPTMGHSRSL
jgi:asparagine synthase (glutamine-hydrolysing)